MKKNRIAMLVLLATIAPVVSGCTSYNGHGLPPIDMRKIENENSKYPVDVQFLANFVKDLVGKIPQRVPGSKEENDFTNKLLLKYKEFGFEPEIKTIPIKDMFLDIDSIVQLYDTKDRFVSINIGNSLSTDENGVVKETLPIDDINNISSDMKDKIAFYIAEENADINEVAKKIEASGASGMILSKKGVDNLFEPVTLKDPIKIPARFIKYRDLNMLINTRKSNGTMVTILKNKIEAANTVGTTLITTLKAKVETKENIIIVTNSDSTGSPGTTSNATASALMVDLARVLKDVGVNKNIIFIQVSSGNLFGYGYKELVKIIPDEIKQNNILTITLDSIASSNTLQFVTSEKDAQNIEDIVKNSGIDKFEFYKFYNKNSAGSILSEAGFKTMEITELNTLKGTPSDFSWVVENGKYSQNINSIIKILQNLGI